MQEMVRRSRQKLLAQREKLAAQHERNREQSSGSGSPTVPDADAPTRSTHSPHSTVPEAPRGSAVDSAPRIYGLRFEQRD